MGLDGLSSEEKEIAIRCLGLVATSQIFENDELMTVTGFDRAELEEMRQRLEVTSDIDKQAERAIGQCFNNLTGYPHGQDRFVERQLGTSMELLRRITAKWLA